MSKGEDKIIDILNRENIKFIREKSFDNLRGGRYRFDFYIPNFNGRPLIIEYDGEQHFSPIKKFHKTTSDFKATQEHDRRKNSYCLANKILLYRIPYWKIDKINTILDITQDEFLVKNKWHNDYIYKIFTKNDKN